MPASHAVRIASSSELRSGVNCDPCGSSPNLFGREVATGVYIGQQAAGMSDPTELRSGQERGHGILELCFGAICSPCETSANLAGAEVATGVYIEQQAVGMSNAIEVCSGQLCGLCNALTSPTHGMAIWSLAGTPAVNHLPSMLVVICCWCQMWLGSHVYMLASDVSMLVVICWKHIYMYMYVYSFSFALMAIS